MATIRVPHSTRWAKTAPSAIAFVLGSSSLLAVRSHFFLRNSGHMWRSSRRTSDFPPASEFLRNLSCYKPVQCVRNGGALVGEPLTIFFRTVLRLTSKLPEAATYDLSALASGLTLRLACLAAIPLAMLPFGWSLNRRLSASAVVVWLLSGIPQLVIGRQLVKVLPISAELSVRLNNAMDDIFHNMNFIFYDYVFIAVSALVGAVTVPRIYSRVVDARRISWLLAGFLLASLYEVLPALLFGCLTLAAIDSRAQRGMGLSGFRNSAESTLAVVRRAPYLVLGQGIWILAVAWYWQRSSPPSVTFSGPPQRDLLASLSEVLGLGARSPGSVYAVGNFLAQHVTIAIGSIAVGVSLEALTRIRRSDHDIERSDSSVTASLRIFGLVMLTAGLTNGVLLASHAEVGRHSIPTLMGGLSLGVSLIGSRSRRLVGPLSKEEPSPVRPSSAQARQHSA